LSTIERNNSAQNQCIAIVGTLANTMLGFRGELIRDLVAGGHTVFAFAIDYTPVTEQEIRAMGATPVSYRMGQLSTNPLSDIRAMLQLYRLFKQRGITLSYCYFSKPAIYGTLAAKLAGVTTRVAKIEGLGRVFTSHPDGDKLKKRILRRIMAVLFRISLPHAHKVLVLNEGDKQDLQSFSTKIPEPTVLGGIGVCLKRYPFRPPVTAPVRFIFVGRLLPEKGVRYFVEAAKALKTRYPDTEFILVGAPDNKPGAINKAELDQLVCEQVVTWPGPVDDVAPWLARSSVFVLPTYYREGVPRSTQEALAMGRPVITTRMPGCRKTVREGANGYLIEPHDQAGLERAMLEFIRNPDLIPAMGVESYRLAKERFDVRKINQSIMKTIGVDIAPIAFENEMPDPANDWHAKVQTSFK